MGVEVGGFFFGLGRGLVAIVDKYGVMQGGWRTKDDKMSFYQKRKPYKQQHTQRNPKNEIVQIPYPI